MCNLTDLSGGARTDPNATTQKQRERENYDDAGSSSLTLSKTWSGTYTVPTLTLSAEDGVESSCSIAVIDRYAQRTRSPTSMDQGQEEWPNRELQRVAGT